MPDEFCPDCGTPRTALFPLLAAAATSTSTTLDARGVPPPAGHSTPHAWRTAFPRLFRFDRGSPLTAGARPAPVRAERSLDPAASRARPPTSGGGQPPRPTTPASIRTTIRARSCSRATDAGPATAQRPAHRRAQVRKPALRRDPPPDRHRRGRWRGGARDECRLGPPLQPRSRVRREPSGRRSAGDTGGPAATGPSRRRAAGPLPPARARRGPKIPEPAPTVQGVVEARHRRRHDPR